MKMNGGVISKNDLSKENIHAVQQGCANLGRHIENVKSFGIPVVVAINHFVSDTNAEIEALRRYVADKGTEAFVCKHWAEGSTGILPLANKVVEIAESKNKFSYTYKDDLPLIAKIEKIATKIYRADEVLASKPIRDQLQLWENDGYGNLPICMAKTQYSFTTDPNRRGAPNGHSIPIREVRLSAGAGFIVVICGEVMTMPGLPKVPSAESIMLNKKGDVEGLF